VYRFLDPTARAGGVHTYVVEEIDVMGKTRRLGPYTVTYGVAAKRRVRPRYGRSLRLREPRQRRASRGRPRSDRPTGPSACVAARCGASGHDRVRAGGGRVRREQDLREYPGRARRLYAVTAEQIASALGKTPAQVRGWIRNGQMRLQQKDRTSR
jgi:hypothetical protein